MHAGDIIHIHQFNTIFADQQLVGVIAEKCNEAAKAVKKYRLQASKQNVNNVRFRIFGEHNLQMFYGVGHAFVLFVRSQGYT